DDFTVQSNFNLTSLDADLLHIPLAYRLKCSSFCRNNTVNGTMVLIRRQILIDFGIVIQNLNFVAYVRGITFQRSTNTYSIVSTRRQFELKTVNKVCELVFGINILSKLSIRIGTQMSFRVNLVSWCRCPLIQVCTIKQHFESFFFLLLTQGEHYFAWQFLEKDISIPHLRTVCLQFDLLDRENRLTAVPEVFHHNLIHHLLTIQPNRYLVSNHTDFESIPIAKWIVRNF